MRASSEENSATFRGEFSNFPGTFDNLPGKILQKLRRMYDCHLRSAGIQCRGAIRGSALELWAPAVPKVRGLEFRRIDQAQTSRGDGECSRTGREADAAIDPG